MTPRIGSVFRYNCPVSDTLQQLVTRRLIATPPPYFLTPPRAPTWGNADIEDCPRLMWLLSITITGDPELFCHTDWGCLYTKHFALSFGIAQNKISHAVFMGLKHSFCINTLQAEAPLMTIQFHLRAVLTQGQVVRGPGRGCRVAWTHNSILTPASLAAAGGHIMEYVSRLRVTSVRKFSNMRWSIAVSSRHTNYSTSAKICLV